ncbi:fluoride efflux transporter CrcB [Kribbella solani]|uniref:Fluoride-specific ion channel FluC n=1 Tax=Kribbella solani TaxID=236067 RepID=A0A841DMH3_9ACTN|nr:fluoride efflux transporter CrcB [Kribbella solani]MBB5977860.1 CrcB protein [Kribbella solani]
MSRLLLVIAGGLIGAPLRYVADRAVQARHDSLFPWGTFSVNVIGSFILGFLTGASSLFPDSIQFFAGTGFCGALTTYSTFSYETIRLFEDRARFLAVANVTASIVAGLGSVFLGTAVSQSL